MLNVIPVHIGLGKKKIDISLASFGTLKWFRSLIRVVWAKDKYFLIHFLWLFNFQVRKVKRKRAKKKTEN